MLDLNRGALDAHAPLMKTFRGKLPLTVDGKEGAPRHVLPTQEMAKSYVFDEAKLSNIRDSTCLTSIL